MFNSGIKGNQRCNGTYSSPSQDISVVSKVANNTKHYNNTTFKLFNNKLENKDVYRKTNTNKPVDRQLNRNKTTNSVTNKAKTFNGNSVVGSKVIKPEDAYDFEDKIAIHSIIGLQDSNTHKTPLVEEQKPKKENIKATHHETLERIECEIDAPNYYQQHWFSPSLEQFKLEDRSREERIEITRHELWRRLQQLNHIGKPNRVPHWITRRKKNPTVGRPDGSSTALIVPKLCEVNECGRPSIHGSKYCAMHIMYDSRQILFEYCTAKFADNTQCSVPVFDISHDLPLCAVHARKRDNYRLYQEAKPKRVKKKVKPSAMIRPQKRNKKKKKSPVRSKQIETITNPSAIIGEIIPAAPCNGLVTEVVEAPVVLEEDLQMVDQVLALNENGLEQALANQAHLLEETDLTNVFSTIQVDEFSDFFAVNRNGEYEPSREEAEELEKALAAVDNDVKSLEKLSQTHGLLDSFLDEHALSDSLVQIPELIFHNGYAACGDNIVTQNSSYLLPVEPHSHS
ncbi:unnamed protein product [Ceutorhynchus assimilis]|uniref:KANL2-like probable zinc-finger domain-containing protein n=1 Tax=Ceutorhynchus assimilis TaxID=467358 RepID=A0A9P0DHY6_9CUCU|nr:unnamed protein product [Ceutorhynchus assimilis]